MFFLRWLMNQPGVHGKPTFSGRKAARRAQPARRCGTWSARDTIVSGQKMIRKGKSKRIHGNYRVWGFFPETRVSFFVPPGPPTPKQVFVIGFLWLELELSKGKTICFKTSWKCPEKNRKIQNISRTSRKNSWEFPARFLNYGILICMDFSLFFWLYRTVNLYLSVPLDLYKLYFSVPLELQNGMFCPSRVAQLYFRPPTPGCLVWCQKSGQIFVCLFLGVISV